MTVDDIMTGALFSSGKYISAAGARRRVDELISSVWKERRAALGGELTIGEKKARARACFGTEPKLLLLDEVMSA